MRGIFFDVDGTLVRATVINYHVFFARRWYKGLRRLLFFVTIPLHIILYLAVDTVSRTAFNKLMYHSYRGMDKRWLEAMAVECFEKVLKPRCIDATCTALAEHLKKGDCVVLVSGSLDFILAPFARHLAIDHVLCPGLMYDAEGRATGALTMTPVADEYKGVLIRSFAEKHRIDLKESYAYADSLSDMSMFESVGHPHVVHPGKKLEKIARERGWEIVK
ncbi:MAG: HAD-IB family hydrolase [Chromatiaceae bacterium]